MELVLSGSLLYITAAAAVVMVVGIIAMAIALLNKPNSAPEASPAGKPAFTKDPSLDELRRSKKRQRAKAPKKAEAILRVTQRESKAERRPKKAEASAPPEKIVTPMVPAVEDYAADEEGLSPAETVVKKHNKKGKKDRSPARKPTPEARPASPASSAVAAKDEGWVPAHPQGSESKSGRLQKRVDKLERDRISSRQDAEILKTKLAEERNNSAKLNAEIAALRAKVAASAPAAAAPAPVASKGDGEKLSAMNYTNEIAVKLNKEIEALGKALTAEKEVSAGLKAA